MSNWLKCFLLALLLLACTFFHSTAANHNIIKVGSWGGESWELAVERNQYIYCYSLYDGREIDIIDARNAGAPVKAASYAIKDVRNMIVSGDYLYAMVNGEGLKVLDIHNPTVPVLTGSYKVTTNCWLWAVAGKYCYLSNHLRQMTVLDISNPSSPSAAGRFDYQDMNTLSAFAVSGNYGYAVFEKGSENDLSLETLDITNPSAIRSVHSLALPLDKVIKGIIADGSRLVIHAGYLKPTRSQQERVQGYESRRTLYLLDISAPAAPVLLDRNEASGDSAGLIKYNNYIYAWSTVSGLFILPVSGNRFGAILTTGYTDRTEVLLKNGATLYALELEKGLRIYDLTNPSAPSPKGSAELYHPPVEVSPAGSYLHVFDQSGVWRIVDVSNPVNPVECKKIPGYPILSCEQLGQFLFLVLPENNLKIMDVTNPLTPTERALIHFDEPIYEARFWQKYLIVRMKKSISAYSFTPESPGTINFVARYTAPGAISRITIHNECDYFLLFLEDKALLMHAIPAYGFFYSSELEKFPRFKEIVFCKTAEIQYQGKKFRIAAITENFDLHVYEMSNSRFLFSSPLWTFPAGSVRRLMAYDGYVAVDTNEDWLLFDLRGENTTPKLVGNFEYNGQTPLKRGSASGRRFFVPHEARVNILDFDFVVTPPSFKLDRESVMLTAMRNQTPGSSETVLLSRMGEETLRWYASASELSDGWLRIEGKSSGINTGEIKITATPQSKATTLEGDINIYAPEAVRSQLSVHVTLKVIEPQQAKPPFGEFATPINDLTVSGNVPITGWALADLGIRDVAIYREDHKKLVLIGYANLVEGARPDVERAYPGYPMNSRAGWGYMMLSNMLPYGDGRYTLHVIATDTRGVSKLLGFHTILVSNKTSKKPFGAIDTPGQGGLVSGAHFVNFGWALTPFPKQIPLSGETITVWVDGQPLGKPVYNQYREDIARLFPNYKNSNGASGHFYLDALQYEDGLHTLAWSVKDDQGEEEGIGSRYFQIRNIDPNNRKQSAAEITNASTSLLPPYLTVEQLDAAEYCQQGALVRTGYNRKAPAVRIFPNDAGVSTICLPEMGRLELDLETPITAGFHKIGPFYRSLPTGSTLDRRRGIFRWQPGPGFLGSYNLEFYYYPSGPAGETLKKQVRVIIGKMASQGKSRDAFQK